MVAGRDGHSINPSISADGKWVVFQSEATFFDKLEQGSLKPMNQVRDSDIYLHHVPTGQTYRVSFGWDGAEPDGESFNPSISPNGSYIAYESNATNLVKEDTNGKRDVFLYRNEYKDSGLSGKNSRVSVSSKGDEVLTGSSYSASVSDDGSVAFSSSANDLVSQAIDTNNASDVFLHDPSGSTKLISRSIDGQSANADSYSPSISGDGTKVAYSSRASDLVKGDQNGKQDVFFSDPSKDVTKVVSKSKDPVKSLTANDNSFSPSISYDGDFVAFVSRATDIVSGTATSERRVYLRDQSAGEEKGELVAAGDEPEISSDAYGRYDGHFIGYQDSASGMAMVYSRQPGTHTVVSVTSKNVEVSGSSPDISANGRYAAFDSNSTDLKRTYLGRGLISWSELISEAQFNALPCEGVECSAVYLRDTSSKASEPGPAGDGDIPSKSKLVADNEPKGAGKPTKLSITLERDHASHEFKDVEMLLPLGIGASTKIPKCPSIDDVYQGKCPTASKLGTIHADLTFIDNLQDIASLMGDKYKQQQKLGIDGNVYFGEPAPGDVGLLYAEVNDTDLLPKPVVVPIRLSVIEGQHYRVKARAEAIPNSVDDTFIKYYPPNLGDKLEIGTVYPNITRIKITMDGETKGTNGHPFLTNPTFSSTDPPIEEKLTGVDATIFNYGGSKLSRFSGYQVEGAAGLPFNPKIDIELSNPKPNQVTDVTATLTKPAGDADMRRAFITLPAGLWVNAEAKVGFCSEQQIADWQGADGPCGDVKPVGTATLDTPILDMPEGDAYMIETPEGKPMRMAVIFDGLVKLKLYGEIKLTKEGRIEVAFKDIPPYPVNTFKLTAWGLLKTGGVACGDQKLAADATFIAWEKEIVPKQVKPSLASGGDCNQSYQGSFQPKLSVSSANHQAGASPGTLSVSVTRAAWDDPLTAFNMRAPTGFIGDLDATPVKCTYEQVESGNPPSGCQIGTVEAVAQIFDGKEVNVSGNLYNGVPSAGDFGLFIASFDMPEIAGDGKLVLSSTVNPTDNASVIKTKVEGIRPEYSVVKVKMNIWGSQKSGQDGPLLMNSTFCSEGAFDITAFSSQKAQFTNSSPYTSTGCPLPFEPKLDVSLSTTKPGSAPVIKTVVSQRPDETATKRMELHFQGFQADITKIETCTFVQKSLDSCPPQSKVAQIEAAAWPLSQPLTGSVYLAAGMQKAFITLRGAVNIDLVGDLKIGVSDGSVTLAVDGMPPISGTSISAQLEGGQFTIPAKCVSEGDGPKISLTSTSYSGQTASRSKTFPICGPVAQPSIGLKAKLKPRVAGKAANATFTVTHKGSQPLGKLKIKLGSKRGKRLIVNRKLLKRLSRKRGRAIGRLTLKAKGGKRVASPLRAKGGKVRAMGGKVILSIKGNQVQLSGLGRVKASSGSEAQSYRIAIFGRRGGLLRNPKKKGLVTFTATAPSGTGKVLKAKSIVRVKPR